MACYWTLIDKEQLTVDHAIILRPQEPIMQWVQSLPQTHRTGQAQESSIIKWKWYIQDQAKSGPHGVTLLYEKTSEIPIKGLKQEILTRPEITESPVIWGMSSDSSNAHQKQHTWFTDGSTLDSLVAQLVKNLPAKQETWVRSLGREDPLEKEMQPTPELLPGEFHGQRSWAGCSPWGLKESDTTVQLNFTFFPFVS